MLVGLSNRGAFLYFFCILFSAPSLAKAGAALVFDEAFHRAGQTFLVWQEDAATTGESYHIFRATTPFDAGDLATMEPVARVGEGSSIAELERTHPSPSYSNFLVRGIDEDGAPLRDDQGLLVWTPKAVGEAWYGIAQFDREGTVVGASFSLVGPIAETNDRPQPLLVREFSNATNQRIRVYLEYMDLDRWNPNSVRIVENPEGEVLSRTRVGYAYSYMLLEPVNLDPGRRYPLLVDLHPYGFRYRVTDAETFAWPSYYLSLDDPTNSFWFGFSSTFDYTTGEIPTTGPIVNYTERRVLASLLNVLDNNDFHIDRDRVALTGHSLGGTGVITMALRYPGLFTAAYAAQPITNPRTQDVPGPACPTSELGFYFLERVYGRREDALSVQIEEPLLGADHAPLAGELMAYNGLGVWDWADQQLFVRERLTTRDTPLLMIDMGKRDCAASWDTQAMDFIRELELARLPYSAVALDIGHQWQNFIATSPAIGPQYQVPGGLHKCAFALIECMELSRASSIPAITNSTGNDSLTPSFEGTSYYNMNVLWEGAWQSVGSAGGVKESPSSWSATLYSIRELEPLPGEPFLADVTPRWRKQFAPPPGARFDWVATEVAGQSVLASGKGMVSEVGDVTAEQVPIVPLGTRLFIATDTASAWWLR